MCMLLGPLWRARSSLAQELSVTSSFFAPDFSIHSSLGYLWPQRVSTVCPHTAHLVSLPSFAPIHLPRRTQVRQFPLRIAHALNPVHPKRTKLHACRPSLTALHPASSSNPWGPALWLRQGHPVPLPSLDHAGKVRWSRTMFVACVNVCLQSINANERRRGGVWTGCVSSYA